MRLVHRHRRASKGTPGGNAIKAREIEPIIEPKVRKKGFSPRANYPAPQWAIDAATGYIERTLEAYPETIREVHAELRVAVYCGPGSAGDRGAYMLSCSVYFANGGHDFFLRDLYPPA